MSETMTGPATARESLLLAIGDAWAAAEAAGREDLAIDLEADAKDARMDPDLVPARGVPVGLELWGADAVRRMAAAMRSGDVAEARRQARLLEIAFGQRGPRSSYAAAVARHAHRVVRSAATGWPLVDEAPAVTALRVLRVAAGA